MGVGAADAEGRDGAAAGMVSGLPVGEPVNDLNFGVGVDEGIEFLEVERAGNLFAFEGERGFEQAGHAGGGVEMADVGLDRADLEVGGALAVNLAKGAQLDRVADGGAGAVGLDVVDGGGIDAGCGERLGDHFGLAFDAGREEADFAAAVVIDGAALDDGVDGVAGLDGVFEAAQDHDAEAAAENRAGGVGVEGAAMAVVGLDFVLAIMVADGVGDLDADGAGQGHVATEFEEALAGEVDRDEGGGAGGLDVDAGPAEVHLVRGAGGEDVLVIAGVAQEENALLLDEFGVGQKIGDQVGVGAGTGEDTGRSGEGSRGVSGVFEGLPRAFEEEALLGVHDRRLAGADAEEGGIEGVELGQGRAGADVIGVVQEGLAHADGREILGGELADRLDAVDEVFPKLGGVVGTGEARGEADDRDVGGGRFGGVHEVPLPGARLRCRPWRARDCRRSMPRSLPLAVVLFLAWRD